MNSIYKVTLIALITLFVIGCTPTEAPGGFETGEETSPPLGCIAHKSKGGDC